MQKLSSEDSEIACHWGGFYSITWGFPTLCDIRCYLGCSSTSILFVGGPKYSCKSSIPLLVFQTDYGVFLELIIENIFALYAVVISWLNNVLSIWKPIVVEESGLYKIGNKLILGKQVGF